MVGRFFHYRVTYEHPIFGSMAIYSKGMSCENGFWVNPEGHLAKGGEGEFFILPHHIHSIRKEPLSET